ncbi:MAG: hypothetical protein K0Q92_1850 [Steroidobacteraceae bacterium]|nr:hypothetical protein [Steroidobacteraceae bacterium]
MSGNSDASFARRTALASAIALALTSGGFARAQDAPQAAAEGEDIIVTGSRIARGATDASTPLAIIDAEEFKLSGSMNVDKVLGDSPQFVQATNGGATANTVPAGSAAGAAYANLRGFGPTRSLTLVNGRRYAIFGPEQVTDLNTIPTALIERTEIVTGGSSAVYGSDAITGVINFIMKDDFEGVQLGGQYGFDTSTSTPVYSADLTLGGNFGEGRGNAVVSLNYYKRDGFTRHDRGDWAELPYGEGCVTAESHSSTLIGTPNGSNAADCAASGGRMGFVFSGSGDIPNGRFSLTPAQMTAAATQLAAAGLAGMGANGFTFNDAGTNQRLVQRPADDFNLTQFNYLQVPQERWMLNAFTHYDFTEKARGYLEFHFSNNRVDQQLTQANIGGDFLFNVNNPYLDASMQAVLAQLDASETGPRTLQQGPIAYTTTPNDGFAVLTAGRRLVELPFRHNVDDHNVWRTAIGMKGDLGDVSDKFFRNLSYDAPMPSSRCWRLRWAARLSICPRAQWVSRWASNGARPKPSTSRMSTFARVMSSASIPVCRPRGTSRPRTFSPKSACRSWPTCPSLRASRRTVVIAAPITIWMASAKSVPTFTVSTGASMSQLVSGASSSVPSARLTSATCTVVCS